MPRRGSRSNPGGRRHACLFEHARRESEGCRRKSGHIGVQIERAIRREETNRARPGQALEQDAPVVLIAVTHLFELGASARRRLRRRFGTASVRDRQILLQALDRPHQRRRNHHPPDPPSGHAEIFGERVDETTSGKCGRRFRRQSIVGAVIDFVGDHGDAGLLGAADELRQCRGGHHGAGWIGGRGQDDGL